MQKTYTVNLDGYKKDLPVVKLPDGCGIAFFNLHGDVEMTEHCGKSLAKLLQGVEVLITAESKGLQLCHVCSRELNLPFYAVARKSKKLYLSEGAETKIDSSITTGHSQSFYLSRTDFELIKGKKVGIIDDVVSTGASLKGLEDLVKAAGGIIYKKGFCLAEHLAAERDDIIYLDKIPLFYE